MDIKNAEDRVKNFMFTMLLPGANDQFFAVKSEVFTINIIDQPIGLSLFVNGSADNKNIELGNALAFGPLVAGGNQQLLAEASASREGAHLPQHPHQAAGSRGLKVLNHQDSSLALQPPAVVGVSSHKDLRGFLRKGICQGIIPYCCDDGH